MLLLCLASVRVRRSNEADSVGGFNGDRDLGVSDFGVEEVAVEIAAFNGDGRSAEEGTDVGFQRSYDRGVDVGVEGDAGL